MENQVTGVYPAAYQNAQIYNTGNVQNQEEIKVFKGQQQPNSDTVSFSGSEEKVSGGNKFLSGAASLVIPGLGQLINGEGKKGLKHFLGQLGLETGAITLGCVATHLAETGGSKTGKIAAGVGAAALGIGAIVNAVKSCIDAAKNAKNK